MNCPACAHENRAGAKFCEECAAPLKRLCASCGSELRPSAKFCDECGASLGASAAPRPTESTGARKVVAIVFADLVGSTALHERLDPESARRFMEGYYAAMRGAVEAHGGTVTQLLGDGVKAVFGIPRVAEDDAIRAVRAAVAMQEAFRALAEQQRGAVGKTGLRVAVNSGEVIASDASEVIGDPVNVAARLQEQGRDGDVVIGEATQRLVSGLVTVEPLGSFALKGRTEAVKAYRVISLERPEGAAAVAFVGRDAELARIQSVYETAIAKPATALAVLLGSPGLGKSRLIDEFARRLGDGAAVIQAHCDAAGGASFAPLADALRALPDLDAAVPGSDAERTRILDGVRALLAGSPASPEETFFVVRRLLSALAATRPVVLVIDDVHWAEPLLLDLVEHLVQWGSGVPLLVLVGARPELRELRSTLVTPGGLVSDVVTLAGLDAGAAMRLAANVIGAADLPASVAAKVLATSEGNPLFVGELVRMLVHEGALKRDGDRWTAGTALAALEMPPTIHALLAARIERLRPEERVVLERAAVIGRSFSRSAVAELLSRDTSDLDARLESLRRAELIERDTGWFLGEPLLRFHHVLIRDAAYRRILKGTRAELHARFADWIEARAGGSLEHDETIGWHLEQAHQHLRELGPIDARGRALGERAAVYLAAAGRRALARDDVPLASGLLGRALDRLDPDDVARAELALDWCEALLAAGDVGPATAALAELERFAANDARLRAWHTCFAGQLTSLTAPQGLNEAAEAVAKAASDLAALGDVAGEAKAHFVHAQTFARLGRVGACEAALDRALAAARRAGDRRRANTVLAVAPLAALWGPSPVTRASGRCLDVVRVLRITQGAPAVEAVALSCQGVLEALRGRTDAARRMIASARKMVEELGITQRLLEADVFAARIDLLDGDAAAAEHGLRVAYEGMRELGLGIDAARAAALLARALLQLDRASEAEALTHESERLAGDDLQAAIAWRGARAEALARRGETVEAVELASKAVEIAAATDALLDHADARLALAAALRSAGRSGEADTEERRATELWEAKGATLLAERSRRESDRPESVAAAREAHAQSVRPTRRRVTTNAALASFESLAAAVQARDIGALPALIAPDFEALHRPTGTSWNSQGVLTMLGQTAGARDLTFRVESLATLGDSLALALEQTTFSELDDDALGPFGAVERERLSLLDVDASGRQRRVEFFAADRLGAAIARLYERYAELLPDGPERTRATAIARAAGVMLGQPDLAATATILATDIEFSDLRTVGFGTLHGAEAVLQSIAAMMDLSRDDSAHIEDVLVLEPDALVVRWTNSGTDAETGGAFERKLCQLWTFDASGLLSRWQQFEVENDAAALARFDALIARPAVPRSSDRLRANAATRNAELVWAALLARDVDALRAAHSAQVEIIHHPTGATYGATEVLAMFRAVWRTRNPTLVQEPRATLGESLALIRRSYTHDGSDSTFGSVGASEADYVVVSEVDAQGLARRSEVFASERLGEAVARLYERHAELLPDGPERERAAATARALGTMVLAPDDLGRVSAVLAPDFESVDHRHLSTWSLSGSGAFLEHMRALHEVANDIDMRVHEVLALEASALLTRRMHSGTDRVGGGAYERLFLVLFATDADGQVARAEWFDAEREAEALARFDALSGSSRPEPALEPFDNEASRADRRLFHCFNARDWEGVLACVAPELVFDERRRMVRNTCGLDVWLEQFRFLFDVRASRFTSQLLATRGERLSLNLHCFEGEVAGGGGPLAMDDQLALHEVDRDGRIVAIVLFDEGDEEPAHAELDARFQAGEASAHPHVVRALDSGSRPGYGRDWRGLAAGYAAGLVYRDHRLLGWGSTGSDSETFIRVMKSVYALSPDARYRLDHVRISARAVLRQTTLLGTREGGAFENPMLVVGEVDEQGRIESFDTYDLEDLDRARARFAELAAPARVESPFANAASRFVEQGVGRLWAARDWDGIVAKVSPAMRMDDRRRIMRLEIGYDDFLAQFRMLLDQPGSGWHESLLATRGERLSLHRTRFEAEASEGGGPLAFDDHLSMTELDANGRWIASVTFDLDDLDAAYAELDRRYEAGEDHARAGALTVMREFTRAVASGRWDPVLALCSPTLVEHDHRPLAVLGTTRGAEAWVQNFRVLAELAPDSRYRVDHFRATSRGFCSVGTWVGTREGGPYELPLVAVIELDERSRIARADIYDADQLGRARARFEEIRASTPHEVLAPLARPNAASAAMERWRATFDSGFVTGDWEPMRALCTADMVFEDRRRLALLSGDSELMVASARERAAVGARPEMSLVGTAGDRVVVLRLLWSGGPRDGRFEIEYLGVVEVDASGLITAIILLDPGDARAAQREAWARWAAIDRVAAPYLELLAELVDAWNGRDRAGVRARFADGVVVEDHRRTGLGRVEGADAYVDSNVALWELAPKQRIEFGWSWPAHDRHAALITLRRHGTLVGGGAFESEYLWLSVVDRNRITRLELFEIDALDAALARFEELRPDPRRIRPNAASRASNRAARALEAGDREALRAMASADFHFEDRGKRALVAGDVEVWLDSVMFLAAERRARLEPELLATIGDRIAVYRDAWSGSTEGGDFELGGIRVFEVTAEDKLCALVLFDFEDRDAAFAEALTRFALGEAAGCVALELFAGFFRALNERAWEAVRESFTPDVVVTDHRPLGLGVLDRDTWVASLRATVELSVGLAFEVYRVLAWNERGIVLALRRFGSIPDGGGPFENFPIAVALNSGDRIARYELFDETEVERAVARFAELCASLEA